MNDDSFSNFLYPEANSNPRAASFYSRTGGNFKSTNSTRTFSSIQTTCSVCKTDFESSEGSFEKFSCCFCHNAVCLNCSSISCFNQISQSNERFCNNCESDEKNLILENLRKSLENETDLRIAEIGRRKELEEKVSEMENRVGEKDLEIEKLGRKIEQIDRESRMMTDEITQKVNKELFEEKAKVERFSRDLESKDLEIKKLLNASDELSRLKAENEELKKKLTSAMRDTKASSCGCLLF